LARLSFALAYEMNDSDAIAAFWFQLPQTGWSLTTTTQAETGDMRDDAVLVSVEVMTPEVFGKITTAPAIPSAGYVPIPNVFTEGDAVASDCAFS